MIRKGRGSGSRSGEPFLFRPLCPCILRGLGSLSLTSPRSPLASPSKAGLRSPQRAKKRDEDNRHDRPFVLVSYGGLVRSRSQAPGPPSLRPAKLGYARLPIEGMRKKVHVAADRPTLGLIDRAGARVAAAPFRQNSNSFSRDGPRRAKLGGSPRSHGNPRRVPK